MRRHTLVALPVAYALAAALLSAFAPSAHATKEYARKEQKDCSYCHINDKGSGPRNAKGREFEANGYKFGVKSWSNEDNSKAYLRANAAYAATWYFESLRVFGELEKTETLPGGLALVAGRKDRMKIFPATWLRGAHALLKKGARGRPNALNLFLVRLESQFPATDEGKEATKLLDTLAEDKAIKAEVEEARAREKLRVTFLEARTDLSLGDTEKGRKLLEGLKDEKLLDEKLRKDVVKILAGDEPTGD